VLRKGHVPVLAVRVFIFVWGTNSIDTKLFKTLNEGKLMLCGGTVCVVSKGNGKVVLCHECIQ
jgi:hypothetical protein